MLKGKTVVLGVTGSIAAYKMANVASMLVKLHADVHVIMTENACQFITPVTFETLTGNKCMVDTFDRNFQFHVAHISIAKKADVLLVAPASANVIGKLANGIADDMLTTTAMACTCQKIVAPAMNTNMYHNPILQDNLKKLEGYGFTVIAPEKGLLACRDIGDGKMPSEDVLVGHILREIAHEKDLAGMKVIVTAGPTQESVDPVRYITNHSTGKMGYELAKAAMLRGAEVTLVSGVTNLEPPMFVDYVQVKSAGDMFEAMKSRFLDNDIIIKAAAVADYKPKSYSDEKTKKKDGEMSIELDRTQDILKYLGEHRREGQFYCGFSMETQNMLENSRVKLDKKNIDMVVANNLKIAGSGFGTDTNVVTMISKEEEIQLELLSKAEVAHKILDEILKLKAIKG
ncbi:bifunctional phosphopantothenoylcysteine decarboxylase/phosphopantothenate--cysteine ligase CoaBC [Firmicutes bacterium AM29-6AC]|jgi:phosphopantothenoylcysteine decarboxylase/phosphopantothenate--cysteine ligase|uniref:Coenzyme A biosynthesis bifunctional protein CoaBC n=1 Tax=Anaerotignum faecicola TaxID=2358141 RepID=A0A401LDP4_9FIRM|nr:bifunctional phosphopantothenoylcysteine decarboxylase/phosphopantothenate--cysteine ligase CoaBC [Anaerotignum faecicola]RHR16620.1 bifunctional phosphopantothenoylcysteine decarboxylase/phosphopantothenate--cysteine ligase CoaBC [Firmicutes bacterium AF19-2LB]RHT42390.1 bifunctional phosphopantothenoylcysteine decarboxylase/phosphopantothenate--cysteine ligase CoaBC [Firmicutes bacterium AM29-6AC]GCB29653.1 phosphopantothenoylcysteine decarboxylase [Anaerotignum faecicola]HBD87945.1 bifunc